jgi:hypothetical protein
MRDIIRLLAIPIAGIFAFGIIFMLVVWAGGFQPRIENEQGKLSGMATKDLGEYQTLTYNGNCDNSYFPVCGLDGTTYDNACKAVSAGTKVSYRGACREEI